MTAKKKPASRREPPKTPEVRIENCNISANAAVANEHTRDSVVALAAAITANANAVIAAANALKGGDARIDTGIRVEYPF